MLDDCGVAPEALEIRFVITNSLAPTACTHSEPFGRTSLIACNLDHRSKNAGHLSRMRRAAQVLIGETAMGKDPDDSAELVQRLRAGDRAALATLLDRHRDRLRRMVEVRLDARLQARLDASDVVQEACVDVATQIDDYLRDPKLPLFLWLRLVVGERLMRLHRHHLGAQMRDVAREVSLYRGALPAASSAALAAQLLGRHTSPTQAVLRAERILRLQEALNALEPIDREILSLRHFEELTAAETARALGIEEAAAAKRYFRALKRLKEVLGAMPGGPEGF